MTTKSNHQNDNDSIYQHYLIMMYQYHNWILSTSVVLPAMETLIFGPKLSPQEINLGADIISHQPSSSSSSSSTANISVTCNNSIKKCTGIGRLNEGIFAHIDIHIIQHYYHVMNLSLFSLQSSLINYNYIIYHHECKGFVVSLDHCNE